MRQTLPCLIFSFLLLLGITPTLLASGGPLLESDIVCELSAGGPEQPQMVFRVYEAPSSEMRGDVIVYRDRQQRGQMFTSMPQCHEQRISSFSQPIELPQGARHVMLCGVAPQSEEGSTRVRVAQSALHPNRAGYRAAMWSLGQGSSEVINARLEQLREGRFQPVYAGVFVCRETPRHH